MTRKGATCEGLRVFAETGEADAKILGLHPIGNGETFEGLIQGMTPSILCFGRLTLAKQ